MSTDATVLIELLEDAYTQRMNDRQSPCNMGILTEESEPSFASGYGATVLLKDSWGAVSVACCVLEGVLPNRNLLMAYMVSCSA